MPVTALRLDTRERRKKLEQRDKPYFFDLRRGQSIGYRKGVDGASWVLREFRNGRYVQRRLGAADDDLPADGESVLSWDEAVTKARADDRPTVTKPGKFPLREAAADYFATRSAVTPHDRYTWEQFIEPKLGDRPIAALTTGELEKWLAEQVPKTENRDERRGRQATANRRFTVLRAILNSAYRKDPARVPSADAWRRMRGFQKVDRARTRVLTKSEAQALLGKLEPAMMALALGALYTGCRLGELLSLRVEDVSGDGRVHVRHSKAGTDRRVPLSKVARGFFAGLTAGRLKGELVFSMVDTPGLRVSIARAMRAACKSAEIDPPAVFHDLRRSFGSLMLNSGAATETIQGLLGHADPRMTRRAYAHVFDETLAAAVEEHLPKFSRPRKRVKRP